MGQQGCSAAVGAPLLLGADCSTCSRAGLCSAGSTDLPLGFACAPFREEGICASAGATCCVQAKDQEQQDTSSDDGVVGEQEHCFAFDGEIPSEACDALYAQFDALPSPEMVKLAFDLARAPQSPELTCVPPLYPNWYKVSPQFRPGANLTILKNLNATSHGQRHLEQWRRDGLRAVRKGRLAVVLMVGHEGHNFRTFDTAMAISDVGLLSGKSVIQLYIERMLRVKHLAATSRILEGDSAQNNCSLPLYVMCTARVAQGVEDFVRARGCFGLPDDDVMFFSQDEMPLVDRHGRYLLRGKSEIWSCPNGTGGVFAALRDSTALTDMKRRMVERLFICSTDNIVAKIADPLLVGKSIHCHADVVLKCVERTAFETAGSVLCSIQGIGRGEGIVEPSILKRARARVVLASEMGLDLLNTQLQNGQLVFDARPMGQLVLSVRSVSHLAENLQHHRWHAVEQPDVPCLSVFTGLLEQRSALRLELSVEDAVEFSLLELGTSPVWKREDRGAFELEPEVKKVELVKCALGLLVERQSELIPLESSAGRYDPHAACIAMAWLHQDWLLTAGANFANNMRVEGNASRLCEVSPLVSYEGEGMPQSFPEELALPLYVPAQFEPHEQSPSKGVPAPAIGTRASFSVVGSAGEGRTKGIGVTDQIPLPPVSVQPAESVLDDAIVAFLGDVAQSSERLAENPEEEREFEKLVAYSEYCIDVMRHIDEGTFNLQGQHGNEKDEDEDEEQYQYAINAPVTVQDGNASPTIFDDSSGEDDLKGQPRKKKTRHKFYMTKRGAKHQIYMVARAVRIRRAKLYGADYADPHIVNDFEQLIREARKRKESSEKYLAWDPDTVYTDSWLPKHKKKDLAPEAKTRGQKSIAGSKRTTARISFK